ncbi:cobalt ECF transporter T component CbiQ [Eubacteriaceae bacterium ES3]|nr:cobalt ECF transporter T component CbiQ [Eubacteriaceae bacterium ES3]
MQQLIVISLAIMYILMIVVAVIKEKKTPHSHHHHRGHKHGEGFELDVHAFASHLKSWSPEFKVGLAVVLLLICIILDNPGVSIMILMATGYLTMIKGGLAVREYFSLMTIPLSFILLGTITIGIDFSWQPIDVYALHLGFFYINTSPEKIIEMLLMMLKVFAAVSALLMMSLTTPSSEIISVMRKAHVPSLIIELMNLIYRYIFILMDVFIKMKNSASSREGYCDYRTSLRTFGGIVGNMLIVSMKKASAYYTAMEARCYDGELLFLEDEKEIRGVQLLAAALLITGIFLVWWLTSF